MRRSKSDGDFKHPLYEGLHKSMSENDILISKNNLESVEIESSSSSRVSLSSVVIPFHNIVTYDRSLRRILRYNPNTPPLDHNWECEILYKVRWSEEMIIKQTDRSDKNVQIYSSSRELNKSHFVPDIQHSWSLRRFAIHAHEHMTFSADSSGDFESVAELSMTSIATDVVLDIDYNFLTTYKPNSALLREEDCSSNAKRILPGSSSKTKSDLCSHGRKSGENTSTSDNEEFVCPLKSALIKLEEWYGSVVKEESKPCKVSDVNQEYQRPMAANDFEMNKFKVHFARDVDVYQLPQCQASCLKEHKKAARSPTAGASCRALKEIRKRKKGLLPHYKRKVFALQIRTRKYLKKRWIRWIKRHKLKK